jgi:hypothetical protein
LQILQNDIFQKLWNSCILVLGTSPVLTLFCYTSLRCLPHTCFFVIWQYWPNYLTTSSHTPSGRQQMMLEMLYRGLHGHCLWVTCS